MSVEKLAINSIVSHRGFFSYLICLLAMLERYEKTGVPIYVDWSGAGNYADANRKVNVFENYFEQPHIQNLPARFEVVEQTDATQIVTRFLNSRIYSFDPQVRKKAARLAATYIKVLPKLTDIVKTFCRRMDSENVLGIHIRSTDQYQDNCGHFPGQKPCLERYLELIDYAVFRNRHTMIYAASDSQQIIEWLGDNFRNMITYDCNRSTCNTAIHKDQALMGYQIGEDVLVESLILSRCQYFIASPSNVSSMVTYWNPDLPFVDAMRGFLSYRPHF